MKKEKQKTKSCSFHSQYPWELAANSGFDKS